MTASNPTFDHRDAFRHAAAHAALEQVRDGMFWGPATSGSTAPMKSSS